jgi:hypothetical protein
MINVFVAIFIAVLIGVGFVGPLSHAVNAASSTTNSTGDPCQTLVAGSATEPGCQLYLASSWGASTLRMVPGFYALVILGVTIGGLFAVFRQTGLQ